MSARHFSKIHADAAAVDLGGLSLEPREAEAVELLLKRLAVSPGAVDHRRVSSLRKKLGPFGVVIETVETGYRLDAGNKARLRTVLGAPP